MTDPVVRCPDHGVTTGEACPECGGGDVLPGERRERLSKFVSGALRHFPDDAGIELDGAGWTDEAALVDAVTDRYDWADRGAVEAVLAADPKGRFEREAGRVRAAYGHSVDVALGTGEGPVPDVLYHGTASRNLEAIRAEGLRPMDRQAVHLSPSVEAAREVGARHAPEPAVLRVDAAAMLAAGHEIARRGDATFTTDRVPPAHIEVIEGG